MGNPFCRASADPACLTPTVVSLAQAAYDERILPSGELETARLAVLADAEAQVLAAIEARATPAADLAAAFAAFDGAALYTPTLLVTPPSALLDLGADVQALAAGGVTVAVVPSASQPKARTAGSVRQFRRNVASARVNGTSPTYGMCSSGDVWNGSQATGRHSGEAWNSPGAT